MARPAPGASPGALAPYPMRRPSVYVSVQRTPLTMRCTLEILRWQKQRTPAERVSWRSCSWAWHRLVAEPSPACSVRERQARINTTVSFFLIGAVCSEPHQIKRTVLVRPSEYRYVSVLSLGWSKSRQRVIVIWAPKLRTNPALATGASAYTSPETRARTRQLGGGLCNVCFLFL